MKHLFFYLILIFWGLIFFFELIFFLIMEKKHWVHTLIRIFPGSGLPGQATRKSISYWFHTDFILISYWFHTDFIRIFEYQFNNYMSIYLCKLFLKNIFSKVRNLATHGARLCDPIRVHHRRGRHGGRNTRAEEDTRPQLSSSHRQVHQGWPEEPGTRLDSSLHRTLHRTRPDTSFNGYAHILLAFGSIL